MANDGLIYFSPTGGSGLSIMDLYECPRKIDYRRQGWRFKKKPAYFPFGSIIHETAFLPYTNPEDEFDLIDVAHKRVSDMVKTESVKEVIDGEITDVPVEFTGKDDKKNMPRIAKAQMEYWREALYPAEQVRAVENKMVSEIQDPKSGKAPSDLDQFRMAGRLDLILRNPTRLRDLKTAKRDIDTGHFSAFGYSVQLATYRYLWAATSHEKIQDIGLFQLRKAVNVTTVAANSGEVMVRNPLPYRQIFDIFSEGARRVTEYIESKKAWPQNFAACSGKYSPCPYCCLCFPEMSPDGEIERTLKRVATS